MSTHARRRNLVEQQAETFKPPVFRQTRSRLDAVLAAARRFLDLQAGSAWNDLRVELATASGTLLDVGCGAQVFRPLMPRGISYRGIDTKDAKARFGYELPDVYYFDGDDWQVTPGSIDVVLCTEVLEHIQVPRPFLQKIFDATRPGGRLLLTVPFSARWHFIPYDYWRYTPSTLELLLTEAGFERICVTSRGNPLTVACYKIMALLLILLMDADRRAAARIGKRLLGVTLLPLLALLGLIGTLSLRFDWGDDCLGYTVTAWRP
jgi:SAM-dependent methyltransferase